MEIELVYRVFLVQFRLILDPQQRCCEHRRSPASRALTRFQPGPSKTRYEQARHAHARQEAPGLHYPRATVPSVEPTRDAENHY